MKRVLKLLGGLLLVLPLSTMADTGPGETTVSATTSSSTWNGAWAFFVRSPADVYVGPQTITTGSLGTCTLSLPYNCNPTSGTGTQADPYNCSVEPVVTNCSGVGVPWVIAAGGMDFDARVYYLQPIAAPTNASPVPLSPWVPVGSALGTMLLVLWMRRRTNVM